MNTPNNKLREMLLDVQDEVDRLLRCLRMDECLLDFFGHVMLDGNDIVKRPIDLVQLFCFVHETLGGHINELEQAWRQTVPLYRARRESE